MAAFPLLVSKSPRSPRPQMAAETGTRKADYSMKKRTVITTETREVWVIHRSPSSIDPKTTDNNADSPEQSLTSPLDVFNDAANNALENPTTSEEQE